MILYPHLSLDDEKRKAESVDSWGMRNVAPLETRLRDAEAKYRRGRERLAQYREEGTLLPLAVAAEKLGMSTDDYLKAAENDKAILITIEEDSDPKQEHLVPVWALLNNKDGTVINPLVVEIAKIFASHKAGEPALGFCDFMRAHTVALNMKSMDETLPNMGPVRAAYADVAGWALDDHMLDFSPSLRDAVRLAKAGQNDDVIYKRVLDRARALLDPMHTPRSQASAYASVQRLTATGG